MNLKKIGVLVIISMFGLAGFASAKRRAHFNAKNLTVSQKAQLKKLNAERKQKVAKIKSGSTIMASAKASSSDKRTERERIRQEVVKLNDDYRAQAKKIAGQ